MVDAISASTWRGGRDVAQHTLDAAQSQGRQFVAGFAESSFVMVGDDDVSAFVERTPCGGRPDAGTGRRRDDDDLTGEKSMSGNLFRRSC